MRSSTKVGLTLGIAALLLASGTASQGKLFSYSAPMIRGRVTADSDAPVSRAMLLAFWSGTQEVPILNVDTLHVEEVFTDTAGRFTFPAWAAGDLRSPVRSSRPRVFSYAAGHEWVFVDFERERTVDLDIRLPAFQGGEARWAERSAQLVGQLAVVAAPLPGTPASFRLVAALEREWQRLPPEQRKPPSLVEAFAPAVDEMRAAYAQWVLGQAPK